MSKKPILIKDEQLLENSPDGYVITGPMWNGVMTAIKGAINENASLLNNTNFNNYAVTISKDAWVQRNPLVSEYSAYIPFSEHKITGSLSISTYAYLGDTWVKINCNTQVLKNGNITLKSRILSNLKVIIQGVQE
jgi:hypothetical protein